MITMTNDQLEKIALLDKLFGALDVNQLKEFAESEVVVARLKGTDQNPEILTKLIREHEIYAVDVTNLKSEMATLKYDFTALVKAVGILTSTPVPYSQELQTLKSKYSVY